MKSRFPPSPGAPTDQFLHLCFTGCAMFYCSGPQPFWPQKPISWKTIFPWTAGGGGGGWFQDDSSYFMFIVSFISKGLPWWLRW